MTDDMQQAHPLYAIDRDQIDAVLGHEGEPGPQQLTTIAALFSRYADFPGAEDIRDDPVSYTHLTLPTIYSV